MRRTGESVVQYCHSKTGARDPAARTRRSSTVPVRESAIPLQAVGAYFGTLQPYTLTRL